MKKKYFWLFAMVLLCPVCLFSQVESGSPIAWTEIMRFSVGEGNSSLIWYETENGGILDGPFQGPMSFLTDKNGGLWAGDTLNARILAIDSKAKSTKEIDLVDIAKKCGLASIPLLLDFAPAPVGKILVADANNNAVIAIDMQKNEAKAYNSASIGSKVWSQINRIHSDATGKIYVEDVALLKTFVIRADGKFFCEPMDGEVGLAVASDGQLAMLVNDASDQGNRQIVISPKAGEPFVRIAKLQVEKPIQWSSLIGFDQKKLLTLVFDTEDHRFFRTYNLQGKMVKELRTLHHDPGYDLTRPEWIDHNGNIFTVRAGNGKLQVFRLTY